MMQDFFLGIKEGQKLFGMMISTIINSVLLSAAYLIGIGLPSLFSKLLGKNFLSLEKNEKAETYWEEIPLNKDSIKECYQQF